MGEGSGEWFYTAYNVKVYPKRGTLFDLSNGQGLMNKNANKGTLK